MTAEERLNICKKCPLMKKDSVYGPTCDSTRYMNLKTGEVSRIPHAGGVRGCACRLSGKVKNPSAHCVANKG